MSELTRLKEDFGWDIGSLTTQESGYLRINLDLDRPISYPETGNEDCAEVESDSIWFNYRNLIIKNWITEYVGEGPIWDVGAGNGFVSGFLSASGFEVLAVEPNPSGIEAAAKRGLSPLIQGHFEDLQLPKNSISVIGCFDVIEHIDDTERLLNYFHRVLVPGGHLVVTVPALPWLWSRMDEVAGHFRRYTKKSLVNSMSEVGFKTSRCSYFMFPFVFPVYWTRTRNYKQQRTQGDRQLLDLASTQLATDPNSCLMRIIRSLLAGEQVILRRLNIPIGTSVVGVFEK